MIPASNPWLTQTWSVCALKSDDSNDSIYHMVTSLLSTHTNHIATTRCADYMVRSQRVYKPKSFVILMYDIKFENIRAVIRRSTYHLVPVRQPVVVVLQQPTAILGQPLNGLQPQSTGQLFTATHGPHPAASTATTVPQCTHPTQLQHRRHEDISQPAVPRHDGNTQSVLVKWRSRKLNVFVQGKMKSVRA